MELHKYTMAWNKAAGQMMLTNMPTFLKAAQMVYKDTTQQFDADVVWQRAGLVDYGEEGLFIRAEAHIIEDEAIMEEYHVTLRLEDALGDDISLIAKLIEAENTQRRIEDQEEGYQGQLH